MLKKIVIPPNIKRIGKRAFEGVNFKYAYKTSTGEVVLAEKLPENPEECLDVISIEELKTAFDGFDYNILLQREKYAEIKKLAETLNKNKFSIPYAYGDELIRSGNGQQFNENADFRFFKSEIPNIQELLSECSEEEKVSFFKFAFTLGCFSTERMTDKNGKETSIMIGQKASSILAQILKNPKMKLR